MAQRKKLDSRITSLIQNGVAQNHRSFFVIVGDRGRDQVVTLHYLLSKARVSARPDVLWCYKKELSFSSNRKKRMNQVKKEIARGTRDADVDDPFDLFVSSTSIRYAYYKETDNILGNTYGMCILQDFEALTPNLLAKTIETVQGGGIVVLLLKTMTSLKQLYTMTMDVHARYRTESQHDTVGRFNERFILSLGGCDTCLVVDDELNVLPLSAGKNVKPIIQSAENEETSSQTELKNLKESLKETPLVGDFVKCTKTLDQAKAVLTFIEVIAEKSLRSTITLTASRGRGKSAALGLAIASAVAYGYSNIFITSPSPENLKTLFEFIFKGFDAVGYAEHLDYDILQSTNPAFQKAIVRVNIFKDHRQTIQWIQPTDYNMLSQAELVVIDEAAAIPLPVVKKLLGPYLVFMASTINGYEGTGRSLSLKLIRQLREQSAAGAAAQTEENVVVGRDGAATSAASTLSTRSLREITLDEPIRYSPNDSVELWLNKLLCLDCSSTTRTRFTSGCPDPSKCELYYVTRDTLFSYHPVSEAFLQMMMSLYVSSHYKNSPNDLQLLSDAPAHHLFVLLPPIDQSNQMSLPEPLVVIQLCMEGEIARDSTMASLTRGVRANGDLIPWVISQQFQDGDFASLSGARVVRIATHHDYTGMGYGARALEQLDAYYRGDVVSLNEIPGSIKTDITRVSEQEIEISSLQNDFVTVRNPQSMPPLLLKLSERPPKEHLHWLGVSYGVTQQLHKFWKRSGYTPVYLRQTPNDLTGEHTCIMMKQLSRPGGEIRVGESRWLTSFSWDFRKRFLELLSYQFSDFQPKLVMGILDACSAKKEDRVATADALPLISSDLVYRFFTPFDLKRLDSYSKNLLDYHVILDLVPCAVRLYFLDLCSGSSDATGLKLSAVQCAILVCIGLQRKTVETCAENLSMAVSQVLALFAKSIKKISQYLHSIITDGASIEVEKQLSTVTNENVATENTLQRDVSKAADWISSEKTLDEDLEVAASEAMIAFKEKQKEIIGELKLDQYAIAVNDDEWSKVKINGGSNRVSISNDASTKKRKHDMVKGTADALVKGNRTGVVDPNNIVSKIKEKKKKLKQKRDSKTA